MEILSGIVVDCHILKGQCREIFDALFFSGPLVQRLTPLRMWICIRGATKKAATPQAGMTTKQKSGNF
jgi:hypothetical protein